MKVDLNELIEAKYSSLIEAMLFVVVEAIQFIDVVKSKQNNETEINTLEFVRENYEEKLSKLKRIEVII